MPFVLHFVWVIAAFLRVFQLEEERLSVAVQETAGAVEE